MALISYYDIGFATVANGSTAVTGTGTQWLTALRENDVFVGADGRSSRIASIESATSLTLARAWPGASQTSGSYEVRITPAPSEITASVRELLEKLRQGLWLTPNATGTLAERAAFDSARRGFIYMQTDDDPFVVFVKQTDAVADWSPGFSPQAGPVGPYREVTAGTVTTLAPDAPATVEFIETGDTATANFGIPAGAGFYFEGPYNSGTTYSKDSVVTQGGSAFIALQETTGNAPNATADTAFWARLAVRGLDGDGAGDVVGPASSGNNRIALFDGTTGKLLKDSGLTVDEVGAGDLVAANNLSDVANTGAAALNIGLGRFANSSAVSAATIPLGVSTIDVAGVPFERLSANSMSLGPERLSNRTFDSPTGWTVETGWGVGGSVASRPNNGLVNRIYQIGATPVPGRRYRVQMTVVSITSGQVLMQVGATNSPDYTAPGTYSAVLTAADTREFSVFGRATFSGAVDAVSMREMPADAVQSADGQWWVPLRTVTAVSNRDALKRIPTVGSTYLTEDGREGQFIWRTGDFSAQVTADTAEGIYIKADAVAATAGAWVRKFDGFALVEWWGWKGDGIEDDGARLMDALNAVRGAGITVYQAKDGYFGTRVTITGDDVFQAESAAIVRPLPVGGATEAFYFTNGNFDRQTILPRCRGFSGGALRLSQVARTDIYIGQINGTDDYPNVSATAAGVIMEGSCLDCKVTIVTGELCADLIKIVPTTAGGAVFQGNEVYCNFSVYNRHTVTYALTGETPWADSNKFQFQAIDPAENNTECTALRNTNGTNPVSRVLFKCETWLGGFTSANSNFVVGYFDDYDIYVRVADPEVGATADDAYFAFLITGSGRIDLGADQTWGDRQAAATSSSSRTTWRGGNPLFVNRFHMDTNVSSVASGDYLTHYMYSPLVIDEDVKVTIVPRNMLGAMMVNEITTTGVQRELAIQFRNISSGAASGFMKYDVILGL